MMTKKIILVLIILVVLALGWFLGVVFSGGQFLTQLSSENKNCLATPCPSASPQSISCSNLSEDQKKVLSDKENFQAGIAQTYKAMPLYSGVGENEVWTFLKPVEGILYTTAATRAQIISFYKTQLETAGWAEKSSQESDESTPIQFNQGEKILQLIVRDRPPTYLPQELNLQERTYVSLNLSS